MSAPDKICALMLLVTGDGSKTMAFNGMGICVAEKRENYDLAWGRELGGRSSWVVCRDSLTLRSAPGALVVKGKVKEEESWDGK